MSESILNRIVSNDTKNQKEQAQQTKLLTEVVSQQEDILRLLKGEAKQAARDRQKNKRNAADRSPGAAVRRDTKDKKDAKKTEGIFSKLGKIFGGLGGLTKLLAGALGLKALTAALKAFSWGNFLKGASVKINGWLFGPKGLMTGLFGKKGILAQLFGKTANLTKGFGKGLGGLFGKKGLGGLLGGIKPGKLVKGGGILSALTAGIMEYFDTKKISEALFSGGGAGAGALAGGALGSLLGPIGTIVGGALGAFIGEKLGDILKEQLDKYPFMKKIFDTWDKAFNGFIKDVGKYIEALKKTFGDFMYMINQIGRAFNRFNKEAIQPVIKAIGDLVKHEWKKFTGAIQSAVKLLDKIFGPTIKKVSQFLEPLIDPLKELATVVIGPLVEGFKSLLDLLNPVKMATKAAEGTGNFFRGIGDFFKNYADGKQLGGFVGTVPHQGADGDRFGAMLAPGSIVLNQRAAGMMQSGGMVPTLLEQGERVYGPNDPNAGNALMMNSMIPRFQVGGQVPPTGKKDDSKVVDKNEGSDLTGKGAQFATGPVTPGGKMTFIGDGSGFTGEVKLIDGAGKVVAKIGGVSGQSRTAGASQEQRRDVSGTMNPLPDGDWPLEPKTTKHAGQTVGEWSAWINNPGGSIGNRGHLLVHNDIGSNGTAGCIGVEAGGTRGSTNSMKFAEMYDQVSPKSVKVNLASSAGGSYSPGETGGGGGGGGLLGGIGSMLGGAGLNIPKGLGGEGMGALASAFGSLTSLFVGTATKAISGAASGLSSAFGGGNTKAVQGEASGDMKKGAEMIMEAGVPKKGAAYLAGNIQQESSWKGQRDWGQVMGDGTSRNGGLVSWASWADDPARLGKIEKHLGKNINQATDGEQIGAMLWEMKKDYPGAYSTFMNPASSAAELKSASKAYWGYGHEGPRYQYSEQALEHLKGMQTGGVANMRGSSNSISSNMVSKSQDAFAEKIAQAVTPTIVPVPMGGGGGSNQSQGGPGTDLPIIPAEDTSVVSMEYKYRITMGASV